MNSTPELKQLHADIFDSRVKKMVAALRARGLKLPRAHILSIARTAINSLTTGIDLSLRFKGGEYRQLVRELAESQEVYLDKYLRDLEPRAK